MLLFFLRDKMGDNLRVGALQGSVGGDGVWKESFEQEATGFPNCSSPVQEPIQGMLKT